MGVDYLYLEALRGTTLAEVRRAIVEEMAAEGFRAAKEDDEGSIEIEVEKRGEWIVVREIRDKMPIEWAERLAHSIGVLGMSARSWSDFDGLSLKRYEGEEPKGSVFLEDDRKVKRLDTAFLVDLAPRANQRKLRAGMAPAGRRSDDLLLEIVKLADLPVPNDRYGFGARRKGSLYFSKPKAPVVDEVQPAVRVRNVRFATSFHVRAVTASEVVAAVTEVHVRAGLKAVSDAKKPKRQLFVREWHGWTSFGELSHVDGAIDWAKVLSTSLAVPILSVCAGEDLVDIRAFVAGRVVARSKAERKDMKVVVDAALLAPFGGEKKLSVKLPADPFLGGSDPRFLAEVVGEALVLEKPILSGSIKGEVIDFR